MFADAKGLPLAHLRLAIDGEAALAASQNMEPNAITRATSVRAIGYSLNNT